MPIHDATPAGFWQKLEDLDERLFAQAPHERVSWFKTTGLAAWRPDAPTEAYAVWQGTRVLGRLMGQMGGVIIAEALSKRDTRVQFLNRDFRYACNARFLSDRFVVATYPETVDIATRTVHTPPLDRFASGVLDGSMVPTPEDYDLLIYELERGASGLYDIN